MMKIKTDFVSSASRGDPKISFKHQILMQDYQELRKETEFKIKKLEMMKQKRLTLEAEVRFLRRRYNHLKQDQTLETSPKMLTLSESGDLKVPTKPSGKRKKNSGLNASAPCFDASCDLEKKSKRSKGNENSTNSISLPDLAGNGNTFVTNNKVPGFDLNQISREEEEPQANGEHMVVGDVHGELGLPIYRNVDRKLNKVKRKVSWQDPVALSV